MQMTQVVGLVVVCGTVVAVLVVVDASVDGGVSTAGAPVVGGATAGGDVVEATPEDGAVVVDDEVVDDGDIQMALPRIVILDDLVTFLMRPKAAPTP